jgi:hypothetical protein
MPLINPRYLSDETDRMALLGGLLRDARRVAGDLPQTCVLAETLPGKDGADRRRVAGSRAASIESLEGLRSVEAIVAVDGIDMIACGHSDLSARLRVHLQLEPPTFWAAVRRVADACNAHGKLARGSAETEAQIEEYWRLGCKVLNLPAPTSAPNLDGLKAPASRAHARLRSIGVPVP